MPTELNNEKNSKNSFMTRHLGVSSQDRVALLKALKVSSLDQLMDEAIPFSIRKKEELKLPPAVTEQEYIHRIKSLAQQNKVYTSFIGQGYYGSFIPPVIQRNILENPGWYTAYTPYQSEIAQGRLEALVNFQTMVADLTGTDLANASLLDEATAAVEAMNMLFALSKQNKNDATHFLVDKEVFPQTLAVMQTRADALQIKLVVADLTQVNMKEKNAFGLFFQYPNNSGNIYDWATVVASAKENNIFTACATDLLALTLLKAPGTWGVDVVVGTAQRLGTSLGYGGPHAAFFATKSAYKRAIPGRIIGISKDKYGNPAYRMALQVREQHIKRARATSNICTAQVLLAVMSAMYSIYHGAEGLTDIATRIHLLAQAASGRLQNLGFKQTNDLFFDTLKVPLTPADLIQLKKIAEEAKINLRYFEDGIGISFDETHTEANMEQVVALFTRLSNQPAPRKGSEPSVSFPDNLQRDTPFLTHPVFKKYQSEHELLRYMKRLENKDLSLTHAMIPLGSCTMKLNATTEMLPVTWDAFANIHPFAPPSQTKGYQKLLDELSDWLVAITGFHAVSFQPNSGAQGEYTGLMVIKSYLESRNEHQRNIVMIPSSAHGTNPASATLAGMQVVTITCDEKGNIDLNDLMTKSKEHSKALAALMITYPSTHGVFESDIQQVCEIIHTHGGLVYMDGANMNAQLGLTSPAQIGADVCHINLHKTFCIPHGGGGPGMGPIAVAKHLTGHLPSHPALQKNPKGTIAAAPFGSASILTISHAFIAMMGGKGLTLASKLAILNTNYMAKRLKEHYPTLYTNQKGRNAHEVIIDCRHFKKWGIEVEDIAKRLIDYGFHAPTISFPVPGTMMIEPTESESKEAIDRYCAALISIRAEIQEVMENLMSKNNHILKNAPHTATLIASTNWDFPYSREQAAFPLSYLKENKFWSPVSRVDNAYGDRNLICNCLPS